ncbi:MAG TPA: rod shape-determining protein MreC, partial [Thermoleophilaceae bacterium]
MYDKQAVRRRRAVLAVLVGLSIVLLTGYFGEGGGGFFHSLQSGAQTILSPIEDGASRAFKPVRDLVGWFGDVFNAKDENKALKKQLAGARAQSTNEAMLLRENIQLRGQLKLSEGLGYTNATRETARVIVRSPTVWYSTVTIDKGRSDGIRVDQPVINGDGLVGHVSAVSGGTATVTLLTDSSSAVSAQLAPDGALGIVKPSVGDPNDMQLLYIGKNHPVTKGAKVVTSGSASGPLQSIYPRGIPIGEVSRVSPGELDLYRTVHIRPWADFRRMDVLTVLTSKQRQSPASASG